MEGDVGAETSEDVSEGNVSEGNGGGREEARIKAADVRGESASFGGSVLKTHGKLSVRVVRRRRRQMRPTL